MKWFNYSIFLIFIILSSCTKDEFTPNEWGPEPQMELTPLAVILTPSHPVDTVSIKTNYKNFTISKPYWVNIEKIEGKPVVIVSADDLNRDNYREGYVTVSVKRGDNKLSRDFVVMQFDKDVINP